jgi:hypothetical protein
MKLFPLIFLFTACSSTPSDPNTAAFANYGHAPEQTPCFQSIECESECCMSIQECVDPASGSMFPTRGACIKPNEMGTSITVDCTGKGAVKTGIASVCLGAP